MMPWSKKRVKVAQRAWAGVFVFMRIPGVFHASIAWGGKNTNGCSYGIRGARAECTLRVIYHRGFNGLTNSKGVLVIFAANQILGGE